MSNESTMDTLGVYIHINEQFKLIHEYHDGDYVLEDTIEYFQLGSLISDNDFEQIVVEYDHRELHQLKVQADAYSFDHEPGFIEMCLELYRFSINNPQEKYRFLANF